MSSDVLSLRLPAETKKRLDALSEETRRPVSVYVREAIDTYLDDLEDYYSAVNVMERVRSGEEELVSLEDVERELFA